MAFIDGRSKDPRVAWIADALKDIYLAIPRELMEEDAAEVGVGEMK